MAVHAVVACSLILTAVACGKAPQVAAPTPPEVTVATPTQRDVTVYQEFVGTTQARESVEIRARVQGFLDRIAFEPSTFIRKGDLLFVIEPEPYQALRDRAEAGIKAAEAGLRRAESDLERLEQAVESNAVSQQEVTRARAERDQASAALLETQAALTNAEIQLDYTTVRSPIDGLVSRNRVDLGNLVGAGEATLLTTVRRIDPIFRLLRGLGALSSRRRSRQRGGHTTRARVTKYRRRWCSWRPGLEIEGKVDSVDNTVDRPPARSSCGRSSPTRTPRSSPASSSASGSRASSSRTHCWWRRPPSALTSAAATSWWWVTATWWRGATSSPDPSRRTGAASCSTASSPVSATSRSVCNGHGRECR